MMLLFSKAINNYIFTYLKLLLIILRLINIFPLDCDIHYPIEKSNNCIAGQCTDEEFESEVCKINNEIIKTQWFNNIIKISDQGFNYADIVTTSNEDLIIITNTGSSDENKFKRNFYGLKNNGRNYFIEENSLEETPFYQFTTNSERGQGDIFSIKLKEGNENKEYIISISAYSFEIYDIDNRIKYEKSITQLFGLNSICQYISSFIKLENNNYALGIIGTDSENNSYFYLIKLAFTSINIELDNPVLSNSIFYPSSAAKTVSCFKTDAKKIICFYQDDSYNYVLIAFDHDLNFLVSETINSGLTEELQYFQCVHYTGEKGAFGYFTSTSNNSPLNIKFKELKNDNTISDYIIYNSAIVIDKKYFSHNTEMNEMVKIDDSKICYVAVYNGFKDMCLVIINTFTEGKIKVKYYLSHVYDLYFYKFTNEIRATLYNGLIAMVSSYKKGDSSSEEYSSLIIFGYPNSTDFDVDISENIQSFTNVEIDLNSKGLIDNNIFGLIFDGTKIIDFSEGLILKSTLHSEINKGDILIENENLILVLNKNANILKDSKIIYAMMATEPVYDIYKNYFEIRDSRYCLGYDDEKNYFESQRKSYIGRHSYCNIVINEEVITNVCNDINCDRCLNNGEKTCINCRYSYELVENDGGKICLDKNEE